MKSISVFLFSLLTLTACKQDMPNPEPEATAPVETTEEQPTLGAMLNEKKQAFLEKADAEKIASYDAGLNAVEKSGILQSALNVGDVAPDFTLKNQTGAPVKLSELVKNGPVIITWYRGGWCPYCNITLAFLQEKLPDFKAAGGQLVALTPELPDNSMSTTEKHDLQFDVLSDVGNKVARNYGVVFKLTDDVAARYQKGFNLHAYNGDDSDELPLAATYVIDSNLKIRYAFLDVDYRNRAEPSEVLDVLNKLK